MLLTINTTAAKPVNTIVKPIIPALKGIPSGDEWVPKIKEPTQQITTSNGDKSFASLYMPIMNLIILPSLLVSN